jgi:hypothetical protein
MRKYKILKAESIQFEENDVNSIRMTINNAELEGEKLKSIITAENTDVQYDVSIVKNKETNRNEEVIVNITIKCYPDKTDKLIKFAVLD